MPTGLLDKKINDVKFFKRNEYSLLLHLNGKESIDIDALTKEQKKFVLSLIDNAVIEECDKPFESDKKTSYQYFDCDRKDMVHWSITGKCNYRCRHCILSVPDNKTKDLSTKQCIDILHQMADCGIRKLSLTGGEVLMRRDLRQLIKECSKLGIEITDFYTNGALFSSEIVDALINGGHRPNIHISYDGVGWHDWVRGIKGAQEIAENAILTAHKAGLETTVGMCIFKDNVPQIRETVNRLAKMNVGFVKIAPMLSMGLWGDNYSDKTLSFDELLNVILDYIPKFYEDQKPCSLSMGGYFIYNKNTDTATSSLVKNPDSPSPLYPCGWAASNLYISSTGTVLPCMELAQNREYDSFPNLLEMPLMKILQDSVFTATVRTKLSKVYESNIECMQCKERGVHCSGLCRGNSKPDFCDLDYNVCRFIKEGWYKLIQERVEKSSGVFRLY